MGDFLPPGAPKLIEWGYYRKRPVVIRAWRNDTGADIPVATREGTMICSPDDWLIAGMAGEIYPCKPAIFALTYDEEIA